MDAFRNIYSLIAATDRARGRILLILIVTMALFDAIGVASIMPFIALLTSPELIKTNYQLSAAFEFSEKIGVGSERQFLFLLGLLVFILLIFSLALKALTTFMQIRFALRCEHNIAKRMTDGFLSQPYSWFLSQNSGDLGKSILSEVTQVVNQGITPCLLLISQGAVILALVSLLVIIDPVLAFFSALVMGTFYFVVFRQVGGTISKLGELRLSSNQKRFTILNEAFGAIKAIKVSRLEHIYMDKFAMQSEFYAKHQASFQVVGQLPRFVLEAIAFGGMLAILLGMMTVGKDLASVLPLVALYAYAGYRLMPALQQIYYASSQIKFSQPAVLDLLSRFKELRPEAGNDVGQNVSFGRQIGLENVTFTYPGTDAPVVEDLTLVVQKDQMVAFVGKTGSGKTTILDVMLGILEPSFGMMKVDGLPVREGSYRAWQQLIGYVPQDVYLIDDTIEANIALGVPTDMVDEVAMKEAAKVAQIHDFVISNLKDEYRTRVGERGVRLSGGQRQRIGIARAIYGRPQVLVLDEATSSLDVSTEKAVMDSIRQLRDDMTIIVVAHRLNTIRDSDTIFFINKGKLEGCGSFDELLNNNAKFNDFASMRG